MLLGGGLFLLGKATVEIHDGSKGEEATAPAARRRRLPRSSLQIMLLDIVFSLDSVITAVGMADDLAIMVAAVVLAVAIMMFSAEPISRFVNRHPTVKVLALSFLLLIGLSLIGDGLGMHIPEGLHLFRDGLLGVRRDDQPADARCEEPGEAPAVACRRQGPLRFPTPRTRRRPLYTVVDTALALIGLARGGRRENRRPARTDRSQSAATDGRRFEFALMS